MYALTQLDYLGAIYVGKTLLFKPFFPDMLTYTYTIHKGREVCLKLLMSNKRN